MRQAFPLGQEAPHQAKQPLPGWTPRANSCLQFLCQLNLHFQHDEGVLSPSVLVQGTTFPLLVPSHCLPASHTVYILNSFA